MTSIPQVAHAMGAVLTNTAQTIARATGFVQRASKLDGARFVQTMVFGYMATPDAALEDLVQTAATLGVAITPQGLEQRCTEAAATCLQQVLAAAVQQVIAADPVAIPLLQRFAGVMIQDSSTIVLPDALADVWPGCGSDTDAGSAALKLQVQVDLLTGALGGPDLEPGRAADGRSARATTHRVPGALYLRDLGYWSLAQFAALDQAGCCWLSRYQPGTVLFAADGQRWDDILDWLTAQGTDRVDAWVTLGVRQRLPARIMALRVPQEVVDQRRRRIREEARRHGRTVSARVLALAAWTIFVTNVADTHLSLPEALVLGRSRWQIELLFRLWKSHGRIDESRSQKPWRVMCDIYAKLLAVLVGHWVTLVHLWTYPDRSLPKAARLIQKHALHLASAIAVLAALETVLEVIKRGLAACCRMNRRKTHPNTYQLLMDTVIYGVA